MSRGHAESEGERPLVFLCHSSGDKERVRGLYRRLVADGVRCWFDEEDLRPGQDWDYEIRRAIRSCQLFLACISKASLTKAGYVQKELKTALDVADQQPEGSAYIIPVRLEECELPERLRQWQWVDLFKDGSYEKLLPALNPEAGGGPEELPKAEHDEMTDLLTALQRSVDEVEGLRTSTSTTVPYFQPSTEYGASTLANQWKSPTCIQDCQQPSTQCW